MPLDPDRLVGATLGEQRGSWEPKDVLLYHLALGAGADPERPDELAYTWEDRLRPLPTFGTTTAVAPMMQIFDLPDLDFDPARVLHGEHDFTVARPLPLAASVVHAGTVEAVYDKGKGALAVVRIDTHDVIGGELLFVNRFSLFLAGMGGFGGERGPESPPRPPARSPDAVRDVELSPQQALLYRLTGDRHPIHVDPEAARERGFDRPILHGLCTFGIVCKTAVDDQLAGDVSSVERLRARFADAVYPGERLRIATWREGTQVHVEATAIERDAKVLSRGVLSAK